MAARLLTTLPPSCFSAPRPRGPAVPVGAVVTLDDNLRRSLDAVLASPASLAVVVDEAGVAAGIVRGETVFARVAEASGDRS